MPLYLVRWPDLSAALVRASSEAALEDILDEVANPEGCTWSVYRGPLFLDLSLPVSTRVKDRPEQIGPIAPEDVIVEDVGRLRHGAWFDVTVPVSDTGSEMCEAIAKKVFPHVFAAHDDLEREPTEDELREAVRAELDMLVRASWRRKQVERRTDLVSRIAAQMDAPVSLVQRWVDEASKQQPPESPEPESPKPQRRRRRS